MCGIVGILGASNVSLDILEGLRRLEYRGYDSAGITTLSDAGLETRRAVGKLKELSTLLDAEPLEGVAGIGHTRWATHGAATIANAHPHATDKVALVHNGIIENFAELKAGLIEKGVSFASETDSEVVCQLITYYLTQETMSPVDAARRAISEIKGSYAIAALFADDPDLMVAARVGSPLAIGRGDGDMFIGSDAYALAPFTNRVTYLEDNDIAIVRREGVEIINRDGARANRQERTVATTNMLVDKEGYRHFMLKEIHEQPQVVGRTIAQYVDGASAMTKSAATPVDFSAFDHMTISACGTAFYAGLVAKYLFEEYAGLRVEADIASELRYRQVPYRAGDAALFISQSGETADTLAALEDAKAHDQKTIAVVNVPQSSIARSATAIFPTLAGPEIGVASTKAFTCQLATLASLAIIAGRQRGVLSQAQEKELCTELLKAPRLIADALKAASAIENISRDLALASDVLYIGRGTSYHLAMEGALKLKEISYIHAEAYAAGELKHGPIALIDGDTPTIVLAPADKHFDKTTSNMHEVIAREGQVVLITDPEGAAKNSGQAKAVIEAPAAHPIVAPIVQAIPVQLLAYYVATHKGTDVDQPRNLAKSVTVE